MSRTLRTVVALTVAIVVSTVGVLAVSLPAQADNATTVARLKIEITRRIDLRLAALRRFDAAATAAQHLTDAHEATLHGTISHDTAGLTRLRTKVAGETTIAALRADAVSMVNDYRVFLLVGPQVRLSIVGDAEQFAIGRLTTVHNKLAELVAKAKAAGKDTTAAEKDLADMQANLDKATSDINGQVDNLLAIQPGPDASAITSAVGAVRRALGAGRADLRAAVVEAKNVAAFLRSIH
jgi:hypothetical protein